LNLATKMSVAVCGVIVLAVASSGIALLASWRIDGYLNDAVHKHLPSVMAAEELEIALLEERGLVACFVLDNGNRQWLEKLGARGPLLVKRLADARSTASNAEQIRLLTRLQKEYAEYEEIRREVIALWQRGEVEKARSLVLKELDQSYDEAYQAAEQFIAANQRYVRSETRAAADRTRAVSWVVGVSVALTIAAGAAMLGLFFGGVLLPLRRMVADARGFSAGVPTSAPGIAGDELRTVGAYLRELMTDVAQTRSSLEDSRSRLAGAEKLATVGKLAASVAHEIRNPLTALKMWLFSIHRAVGGDADVERQFRMVSEEIARLESIVRNFLEFSRPPALQLAAQPIELVLDKTLELVGRRMEESGIQVTRRDIPGLPCVRVDLEQLKQVFINLLNNAAEAIPGGGEICISTSLDAGPDGQSMVVARIEDSGRGMPDDARRRVFEPFFTTKPDGTGLGLAISAQIMARHGGRLVLESTSERGTTFAVWIPTAEAPSDGPNPGR